MNRYEKKVAIVTGGGTGIGRAITRGLVDGGASVVIVGRRRDPLEACAAEYPDSITPLVADITESGSTRRAVRAAIEAYGGLDIVVNNAGAAWVKPLVELTDEEIDAMTACNVRAPLALSRDAFADLAKDGGAIVNISSVAGQTAVPGFSGYAATKAGIDRATKILAAEFGPSGVRVNAVAPGLTDTAMLSHTPKEVVDQLVQTQTALRRVGSPQDVADTVLWLLSDQAAWVTGQVIQASGGLLLG